MTQDFPKYTSFGLGGRVRKDKPAAKYKRSTGNPGGEAISLVGEVTEVQTCREPE